MKDINYANCMQRRCEQCKYYDYCFGYRSKKENENEIHTKTRNRRYMGYNNS